MMAMGLLIKQTHTKRQYLVEVKYGGKSQRDFVNTALLRGKRRDMVDRRPNSLLPFHMIRVLYLPTTTKS